MRRLSILATVTLVCILAGVAFVYLYRDDSKPTSPLYSELAYVPKNSPFVAAISTDLGSEQVNRELTALLKLKQFESLRSSLAGLRFVRQSLGKDAVIAATNVSEFARGNVLVVQKERSSRLLTYLRKRFSNMLVRAGTYRGIRLFQIKNFPGTIAVDKQVVIWASNLETVKAAIAAKANAGQSNFKRTESALSDCLREYLACAYSDLHRLLKNSADKGRTAFKVPWLAALTELTAHAQLKKSGLHIRAVLNTNGRDLNREDVPIATGSASPALIANSSGYLDIGLRDLAHTVRFSEDLASTYLPTVSLIFENLKASLRDSLAVDIDQDLIDQLTGDSALALAQGYLLAAVELKKPATFKENIDLFSRVLSQTLGLLKSVSDIGINASGPSTYVVSYQGKPIFSYGVRDGLFTLEIGSTSQLGFSVGENRASNQGALVAYADLPAARRALRDQALGQFLTRYLRQFQTLRASVNASTRQTTVRLQLN